MSHLNPGLLSAYNSLTDKHLAGYFSNTRIRRHLQRAGLITRSGRIVPDKEYRHKLIQRAHQRHVRECLAQAIFHKVLEMERVHQIEIKRKLEEFARRERVHKIKVERSKRYEEDIIRILSPRPPTGARTIRKQHSGPEGENTESSESPGSSRPNTAPGKMQRPVRLKPIHSNSTTASLRRSSPYRLLESSNENDQLFNCTMDKESRRRLTTTEASHGISPYCLPVINNFVTPVPPTTKRKERGVKVTPSGTLRGRRLRPTTASSGADVNEDPPMLRSSVHQSKVCVNMMYFGKTVHLSHDLTDMRDEVKVFQQHCGGENLCVYKGKLREGETFQFISRRHRGFPFSLTFFLNGLQVERLSSCCEFKHRKGSRLGGRHGHFGFCRVEGASPCYKCIIAMGLDKKPTPPPKRVKEDGVREESATSLKDAPEMETERAERTGEDAVSRSECETSQPQDIETQVKEETAAEEDRVKDDYEEDFEADDEGPAEDAAEKEKKSSSPSSETERQEKERDASETEDDEKDDDIKSRSGTSSSGSDQEESDAEATKDSKEDNKAEQPKEVDQDETAVPPEENKDEPKPAAADTKAEPADTEAEPADTEAEPADTEAEPADTEAEPADTEAEPADTEAEPAVAKDSDLQDSAGDSTEIDISDTSVPSGNENKQSDVTSGEKEVEEKVDGSKQEEETERAKSVQEKLAEAILKESHCSSEPELSDTSTEEEEESTVKGLEEESKAAVAVKSVTFTEEQQTLVEDTKCEKGVAGEAQVVQDHNEMPEPKEQEEKTEQESHQNNDSTDDKVKVEEEDEKAASDEDKNTADKSEVTEDTGATPVSEKGVAEDDKTSEPQDDAAAKSAEGEVTEKGEENEEKTAAEADTQPDEMGQGAKSSEEDESSVSELNKKTDDTAAPDNAEAEATTASETMEMKAEPSEEREALNCEEAPVSDTEKRQQGDSGDRDAASETGVTAENSSSSLEGSRDTAVEKTAEISEDNTKDESGKDDIKEEEAGKESSKDDNQQERSDLGEEQTEKSSVEIDNKVEEKCEEENKEEEKQTNPDEITEGGNRDESEKDDKDKTEEENNEGETKKVIENEEKISEGTRIDSNTEGKANEEQAEKTHSEEEKVVNEEKTDESEKAERGEDSECFKDKNDEEESEEKGADKTNEGEKTNTDADEEKHDEMEKEEKYQNEDKDEQVATYKKDGKSKEKQVVTDKIAEEAEISEITEEPEESADADLNKDNVKISDKNTVESDDVAESEAANEAHGTETTEEKPNNMTEAEDVKKETEGGSDESVKAEVDAENGEISAGAENKTLEDEGEAQSEGKDDAKTAEKVENEIKTKEPPESESTGVKEETVESGDGVEKHEDDEVNETPDTDVVQHEAKHGEDNVKNQDENAKNNSEPETSGIEIKAESKSKDKKDSDETEQDENGNISDLDKEHRDSDLMKESDNVQSNVSKVMTTSSCNQAQSSTPTAVNLDDTAHNLDESIAPSDSKADKHPLADENAATVDPSAADGENGADTEEASKASEEGASVLLKPQAQSSQLTRKNDSTEESDAVSKETPEALVLEDSRDLVTNWVTVHQTSKYFETFVEPLEDLKESTSDAQVSNSNEEVTQSAELPRSASPLKVAKTSENADQEHTAKESTPVANTSNSDEEATQSTELTRSASPLKMAKVSENAEQECTAKESASDAQVCNSNQEATQSAELPRSASLLKMTKVSEDAEQALKAKDVNELRDKSKEEVVETNLESNHSEDGKPCEKETMQVEETEVKDLILQTESEQNDKESVKGQNKTSEEHKGTTGSLEGDKVQDTEQTDITTTEVESIAGSHHSVTSGRPESVKENQTVDKTTDKDADLDEKQTEIEEIKDLPSSKTEEQHKHPASPEGLPKLIANKQKDMDETHEKNDEQSREVTDITDFTTSRSDDGSQEEHHDKDSQPKPSDGSISRDRGDVQLIQDIKDTLSKDRLSTFSVDETLFGRSSYPLLTAARTESGH